MFLIRDARAADLDDLQEVASHLNSVNLPNDRERLRSLLTASAESFAARRDVADRRFVFVLTDTTTERVHGCSMIFAQHGSRRAPHVYFDVLEEERYSQTLDHHVIHRVLRIGYNYKGLTEIGGLVLRPELRGHPERLGTLLSTVRFVYLARHRSIFRDEVLSELMPPLESDGRSLLWEALGRKFTGLSYQEADRLSHENKEFIRALFPEEPIYATLLPKEVQDLIGQVGPATKGVERMLRRIGFEYANRIDPFDGGPHFRAQIDDVTLVAATRIARVADATGSPDASTRFLVTVEPMGPIGDSSPLLAARFRAVVVPAALSGDSLFLSEASRRHLAVDIGTEVAALPLAPVTHRSDSGSDPLPGR